MHIRKYVEVIRVREKSNESAEMYLETILILSGRLPVVRSVDVANELDFKKSSVSIAMKNLREKNQITMTDAGYIYLTEEGRAKAAEVHENFSRMDNQIWEGISGEEMENFLSCAQKIIRNLEDV